MTEITVASDSLWARCFFEATRRARESGVESVRFADVDALVCEVSKSITEYDSWPDLTKLQAPQ